MKKTIGISWINSIIGVTLSAILFSFSSFTGAHSVQVYLDDNLIIDHYIDAKLEAPKVVLDPAKKQNQLIVKYSECGRTVTGRKITMKGEDNKILKEWRFEGESVGYKDPMVIPTKEITGLQLQGNNAIRLIYSSNEFPDGQQVASIVIGSEATTALK